MNILFYLKPKSEVVYLYDDFTLRQVLEKMEKYLLLHPECLVGKIMLMH